jgi:hypothetical protein
MMQGDSNPFDYFEDPQEEGGVGAHWVARPLRRPDDRFDLTLLARSPSWRHDAEALDALTRLEREPWVANLALREDGARLRLDDGWMRRVGVTLEHGEGAERLVQFGNGERYTVQFCDGDPARPLDVEQLRNVALGNALAAALLQAGADVERRSLVFDGERELSRAGRGQLLAARHATLARLGVEFDRTFFESELLAADEKPSARAIELDEAISASHACAAAYWMAAPALAGRTSVHVHEGRAARASTTQKARGRHPNHELVCGPVATETRASGAGADEALGVDELVDWLEEELETDPRGEQVLARLGGADGVAAQVLLGYFLPRPSTQRVQLFAEKLLRTRESPGWDLARARAQANGADSGASDVEQPDYRFAVVQSELYSHYLRLVVERLDPTPLARYLVELARWDLQANRSEAVRRVSRTALELGAHGLGLTA